MITYENAIMELNLPGNIGNQKKRRIAELLKTLHDENIRLAEKTTQKSAEMSGNEKRYLANINKNRCGYWDVCDDHSCGCAPDAPVSQGFDEQVYEQMRLQRQRETANE